MNFKEKMKSILSCILVFMILISSAPVYGAKARFVDVPKTRWSYEYVENMAKLGYLQGKGKGRFAPTDNLTFLESMAALSRLTKPTEMEIKNAKDQYAGLMKELNVTKEWEKEALSVAIYKDIVSVNEVRNAAKQKIFNKPIQKVAASVFLAKAMGLEEKANSLSVVFIEYKDVLEIDPSLRKYLKVLLDADVLDPKGDSTGNFNPKQPLKREILATMLSRADAYMNKNPENRPIEEVEKPETPVIKTEIVRGTIKRINEDIGKRFLIIEDENNRETSFIIEANTKIKVDGNTSDFNSLRSGQEVVLEVEEETRKLISIESEIREEEYKGRVSYINLNSKEIQLEFNQSDSITKKTFEFLDNTRVEKDGRNVNIANIVLGDYAELTVRNDKISSIYAKSEKIEIDGKIVEIEENRDGKFIIYVETKNNREYDILVDKETDIERDKEKSRPEHLRETDEVKLVARYSLKEDMYLADRIDAQVITGKIRGKVIEISNRINQNPVVTLKNNDTGKEESYELSSSVYIEVDGRKSNSLPENPGYEAELHVEGGRDVMEIYIDTTGMSTNIGGRIRYIDSRNEYMEVEVGSGRDKEIIKVYVESRTTITDKSLRRLRMRDLFVDDYVTVVGVYRGANFVADTILLNL